MTPILAASDWRTNGQLIADAASLYWSEDVVTMDPTVGRGLWWTDWRANTMLVSDISLEPHLDFRDLPYPESQFSQIAYDPPYVCVSMDTEILTERGWKRYGEVVPGGDRALTLNRKSGEAEWQTVIESNVYPSGPTLIELSHQSHSSLSTPNHRWPVLDKRKSLPYQWDTTEKFRADSVVPLAAPLADIPTEPKWSDALVEVVAWFWTEGHFERNRDGSLGSSYGNIVQASNAPDRCALIRSALTRLFGPPSTAFPRVGRETDGAPRWRESVDGHKIVWWLSADAGRLLGQHAPGRVPTHEFLLSLTIAQLQLFINRSMLADSHSSPIGVRTLGQRNRVAAESFQFAAILAGYATSLREIKSDPRGAMWLVRLRNQSFFKPSRCNRVSIPGDGIVWCPVVKNETWLARRNGTVYFTGNCVGGRKTTTLPDFHNRYGLTDAPTSPRKLQTLINDGLTELYRVCAPSGTVFFKCQDYISSGKFWPGTHHSLTHALSLGFTLLDRFEHYSLTPRPQPPGRRQRHARRNLSTLFVLEEK